MKVAILGAGRMGQWFARYFKSKGHTVVLSDIEEEKAKTVAKREGAVFARSSIEAVKGADLAMISVSIESTPTVIKEIGKSLMEGARVMEISSIKAYVIKALADLAKRKVMALSIHPLFGPGARTLKGKKIAIVPIKDSKTESDFVRRLFPEATIDVISAEEHDRIMALILSLPHFLNMAFASTLLGEDVDKLRRFAGPSFDLQLTLAESILTEKPDTYASIQIMNEHTYPYLEKFMHETNTLKEIVRRNEREKFINFFDNIRETFSKDMRSTKPYERLYKIIESD
ncbi:MAG: prephenate dehydrogenase/arogenate dehydrogenase family protein [Nitrososphaerales archaeon]